MIILNFHGIGPVVRNIDPGEYACWLEVEHLEAILDRVRGNENVVITFDDGNTSDYHIALPALLKRGMRATFFICSGRIGKPTFLNSAQVRDMRFSGMAIGSHGINHKPWRTLGRHELHEEIADSRKVLEDICMEPIDMAACPFGSYDRRVLGVLRNSGYRAVFTSDGGDSEEDQWLRARTTIKRSISPAEIDRLAHHPTALVGRFFRGTRIALKRFRPPPRYTHNLS